MAVVEYLNTSYLKSQLDKLSNINITLSSLQSAILGSGSKSLTDVVNSITGLQGSSSKTLTDVVSSISSLQSSIIGSGSKSLTDVVSSITGLMGSGNKTLTDVVNGLSNISGTVNVSFPAWMNNSTKLTDDLYSKLNSLTNALSSVGSDKLRNSIVDPLPSGTNWIGKIIIGDGTNSAGVVAGKLAGSAYNLLGVAPDMTKMFAGGTNYTEQSVNVSTTAATSSFSPPLRMTTLCNNGNTDITLTLNGGSTPKTLPAGSCKVIPFFEVSSVSYSVASGSSTLKIEGYW